MSDPFLDVCGEPSYDALAPLTSAPPNNRGFGIVLDPPPGPISRGSPLSVVDTRTNGTARARLLGVQLGIRLAKGKPEDFANGLFSMPMVVAVLEWGIGSEKFAAECDWLHGTQIGLLAETVLVSARYEKNSIPWAPVPVEKEPSFAVGAGVAYGAMARNSNGARLTKLVQLENPNDAAVIPIPPFAVSFTLIPFEGSSLDVRVQAFGTAYGSRYTFTNPLTNAGQRNVENNFPLFNGAEFLRVTNTAGQGPGFGAVVFGLSI